MTSLMVELFLVTETSPIAALHAATAELDPPLGRPST